MLEQERYINIIHEHTGYRNSSLKAELKEIKTALSLSDVEDELENNNNVPVLTEDETDQAILKLKIPTLLYEIGNILEEIGIAGEERNKRLLYLIATSRLMKNALQPIFKADSGEGKSHIVKGVLRAIPKYFWKELSRVTPQSFYHLVEKDLSHRIIFISEVSGMEEASYSLRIMQSEGVLSLQVTEKNAKTGALETVEKEIQTPGLCLILTTTKTSIHRENENRSISIFLDDSEQQRKRIREMQSRKYQLGHKPISEATVKEWQDIQLLLKHYRVVIPFIDELKDSFPCDRAIGNREFPKLLGLIEVSALLHQYQRKITNIDGEDVLYASVADLVIAKELFESTLATSTSQLPATSRVILDIIKSKPEHDWTMKELAGQAKKIYSRSKSWVDKWLKPLVELEFIEKEETPMGYQYTYIEEPETYTIFPSDDVIKELNFKELEEKPDEAPDIIVYNPATGEIIRP